MSMLDLLFPVVGSNVPTDHAYALYAAVCRFLPCLHDGTVAFGMAPITGQHIGNGLLQIDATQSRLRLRLSLEHLPRVLPLAGKGLQVMGHHLRLGVPQVEALQSVPTLIARMVTIKNAKEVDAFIAAARQQLDALDIGGSLRLPEHINKAGHTEPIRRVLRIKERRIVGFSLLVDLLKDDDSLRLQEVGIGGRRHLGAGLFLPARKERP
jgi:CRISPR-associated protein Cas6